MKFQIKSCDDKIVLEEEEKSEAGSEFDMMKEEGDDSSEMKEELPKEFPQ